MKRQDWIKCHRSLMAGKWLGVPRSTRFLLLELATEAKPNGGWFDLPYGSDDPIEALVQMFSNGSRRDRKEVRDGARLLLELGTIEARTEHEPNTKRIHFPEFRVWNAVPSSTERVRAHRERDRAAKQSRGVTPKCNVSHETHETSLEERRGEESSKTPPLASLEAPPKKPRAKTWRGTRLPDGWAPNAKHAAQAAELGVDLHDQAARFRDYWQAKSGKDATKVNWDATFRNWLRRAGDWAKPLDRTAGDGLQTAAAIAAQIRNHQRENP